MNKAIYCLVGRIERRSVIRRVIGEPNREGEKREDAAFHGQQKVAPANDRNNFLIEALPRKSKFERWWLARASGSEREAKPSPDQRLILISF